MAGKQDAQQRIATIDNQIAQLISLKKQYQELESKDLIGRQNSDNLWSKINDELTGIDSKILDAIVKNTEYQKVNAQLEAVTKQELLLLVQDKIANREDGKALLEKQLQLIKDIKSGATKEQQEELLLFAKFKEYSKLHPDTTYEEFLTKIK